MSVFQDILAACVEHLRTDAELPPARADDDSSVALAQNRAADLLLTLGVSGEFQAGMGWVDWRTDVIVEVTARPLGNQTAGAMCDLYFARVFDHLRSGNAGFSARLAPFGLIGVNLQQGDRRVRRDITRTDTAQATTEYILAVYHRTQGDGLTPWPA